MFLICSIYVDVFEGGNRVTVQRAEAEGGGGTAIFKFAGNAVQRDCVLVQRSAAATVFIGLGRRALAVLADPRLRDMALRKQMAKASDEDPVHPGWPARTPGGVGGRFRPKDEDAATTDNAEAAPKRQPSAQDEGGPTAQALLGASPGETASAVGTSPTSEAPVPSEASLAGQAAVERAAKDAGEAAVNRVAMRQEIRALAIEILTASVEGAVAPIPVLGEAAIVLTLMEMAETAAELRRLKIDAQAAIDFIEKGPYRLEDLQVSPDNEAFSSYREFYKGFLEQQDLEKRFGRAGDGLEYHHVVEQGGANATAIPAKKLQSTENIVPLPTLLHQVVSAEYSKMSVERPDLTVRQWMQTLSYERQREEGLKILQRLGIIRLERSGWPSNR
jgi:hypothetical protein